MYIYLFFVNHMSRLHPGIHVHGEVPMKKIVSIQDVSCFGKCSQTIALPVLSAMGIETAIIPTAVLSTHTMFSDFTFKDLTDEIKPIMDHWVDQKLSFDGILTGYIGDSRQIQLISEFYDKFGNENNINILDPVFGDNGKLYPIFDLNYVKEIAKLCTKVDYIVPNITEAAFTSEIPYKEAHDMDYVNELHDILHAKGVKNSIITSIRIGDDNGISARLEDGSSFTVFKKNIDVSFHGTGDLFASAFAGAMLNGFPIEKASEIAVDYVRETLLTTLENDDHSWYGVDFETTIPKLLKMIGKV